ncbi:MAG: efflux RND transporter periplasmic adaptor subunit [Candidatus Sericytochromatia bacterium]|nr:efflux RND transporter periplasmic adaptor subunit [Candidatus Tanganyikabacteria bacterium]
MTVARAWLVALLLLAACSHKESNRKEAAPADPVAVSVVKAQPGPVQVPVEVSGLVVPDAEIRILPKVTGRLLWIVEEWATVKAGQEIARVDVPELGWQLEQARAAVQTAKAGLELARTNRANSQDTYRRVKEQFEAGAANAHQHEQAAAASKVAQAQVEQAQAQVAQAQAGVNLLQSQLGNARLTAPVAGIVTQRLVDVGGMASPAQPLLVLANARRRLVRAGVAERDLAELARGMRARISSVAYPGRVYGGTLIETSPAIDLQTRTVSAKILLGPDAGDLKFGMSVSVRLLPAARQGLVVPASAVQAEGEQYVLFLAEGGKARRVPISVGARMGDKVEIRSGLQAGAPVIHRGAEFLKDGDPIKS